MIILSQVNYMYCIIMLFCISSVLLLNNYLFIIILYEIYIYISYFTLTVTFWLWYIWRTSSFQPVKIKNGFVQKSSGVAKAVYLPQTPYIRQWKDEEEIDLYLLYYWPQFVMFVQGVNYLFRFWWSLLFNDSLITRNHCCSRKVEVNC